MTSKSIVLLSGGMDSLLILAQAIKRGDDVHALFFKYGQMTQEREVKCFYEICEHYNIAKDKMKVIDLSVLKSIGGSSLTDDAMDVSVELDKKEIPSSYVPFRNSIFLSCAVSWAEVLKADQIIIGAVLEDAPGYPDCRPEYYWAFQELIRKGASHNTISIETPIIRMKKMEIIKECLILEAPLKSSWSCYQNNDKLCLKCDSCLLRQRGFQQLNAIDPLEL